MEVMTGAKERAKNIKMIIFDVDGVLTDGGIYTGAEGEVFKPFFCRDGLGIRLARQSGLKVGIITGRNSKQVEFRGKELGFDAICQGSLNKRDDYKRIKEEFGLTDEEIAYVGDDLIDLPIMIQVELAAAVGDAMPEVKARSHIISGFPGGRGAAREVIEFILKAQGKWEDIVTSFLEKDNAGVSARL